MADVNANIGVNIDTSDALNQLKNLQRQISQFHQSVAKSSSTAAVAQRDLQKNFIGSVNAIQGFSAELRTVRSTAESFTNSLEKNKFSMREYFRYAAGATKTFGKNFSAEFSTIERTAIERVKTLQTQYIKMGRDANGAMQAIAIRPTVLDMKDLGTQTAIAAQKQVLFNQLVKQGSTNLLNFGKNTQWAGRQLMVGFTLPLATLGMTAGRVFMDMEKAAIKFKKVYGDLFTAPEETQKAMDAITELGLAYTKYGVAVSDSLSVAADAAAAGFQGVDLQNQTTASLKLSVLGQMELQKALETTIALQNAFRISSEDLVGTIDFLNAVENQTVVSLDDITEATPRVATVIQSLGGNVQDLAFFLAAMKEGGVNAAQGANALKSGLASLINPTERASEMLMGMGVNIRAIVGENEGDLRGLVLGVARALDTLDPTSRARAIEQLFGKFQFARISALFDNVIREGSQASRVLDLAGSSLTDLAELSEKELGTQAASSMNKFTSAIERIKVALVPLGELFLDIATPFIDFGTKVLDAFNSLPKEMKQLIGTVITVVGGLGPVLLMTFGLINNGIANMIKFFATVRLGYLKMTGQAKGIGDETQYMTQEQLEAAAAASSLDQAHAGLTQRFTAEKTAVDALRVAYEAAAAAGARFATLNAPMMKPGYGANPTKMARGGVVTVGGRGNKDTEPALLTPGEAVIPAAMVKKYQPLIEGMIAGNIPGYAKGFLGMPKSSKSVNKNRDAAEEVYQMFLKSSYANTTPTEYGHQISPTTGHSFPIFGLGGVYQKGDKQVFVKPVLDEKAALAEMRSTEISRRAHGLEAPEQRIVVMRDPMDVKRQRRFLALESDLDPKFVNNEPMGVFNEEQYFRQLVASLLRVDKDLSGSNVYGNVVADAGPGGVFNRASGLRDYEQNLPSMEEQAMINLLGIKGGAKRAFAESTLGLMAGLTPEQYRQRMLGEIQKVLPRLKETIASFGLTNPTEVGVYDDMIRRLEAGLGVDWAKFHSVHSSVKPAKPKAATQAAPLKLANGIVSVPGPKGAGDVVAAMLSPGEAVIPAEMAKKYGSLINAMVAGNIPGYEKGIGVQPFSRNAESYVQGSHLDDMTTKNLLGLIKEIVALGPEYANQTIKVKEFGKEFENGFREVEMTFAELAEKAKAGTELQVQGRAYAGTALIESADRNQAYEAAGVAGVPTSLQGLAEAGKLAEKALASGSKASIKYAEELKKIIAAGKEAEIALNSSTSAQEELKYTLSIFEQAYRDGLIASEQTADVEEANLLASKRMLQIREEYIADLAQGMSAEEALTRARLKAANAVLTESSIQSDSGGPTVTSFEEGERYAATNVSTGRAKGSGPGGREARQVAASLYDFTAEQMGAEAGIFAKNVAEEAFKSFERGIGAASPAQRFAELAQSVEQGVELAKPGAEKAGKNIGEAIVRQSSSPSAFGNINTKEPVPAVGNAPREITAAMQKETTAARTFAGDIKASFANVRSNLSRELGFVKEEFASIMQQVKQRFGIGGQELIQVAKNTNQGLVINGKDYGFNAIAQAQGRDGAIEAIVTRKNAELITKVTTAWNNGVREIPPIIPREMSKAAQKLEVAGEEFKRISVDNEIERQRAIQAAQETVPTKIVKPGQKGFIGPMPQSGLSKFGEGFDKVSQDVSNFAFALSAVSGILSLMGGPLQGFAQAITMLTSGMFALIQIVGAIRALEIKSLIVKTQDLIASRLALALKAKDAVVTGAATLGTMVFGTTIWSAVAGLVAFLSPVLAIGLAIAAVAATFMIVNHVLAENEKKVNALGDAAFAAGEKLKNIADIIGFTPTRDVDRGSQLASVEGMDAEGAARATSIRESERFQELKGKESSEGGFKNDIAAIRDADPANAQAALDSLALQLLSLAPEGTDPKKIQEYVAAIAMEAGKEDLDLSFVLSVDLSDPAAFDQIVEKSKTTLTQLQAVSSRGESALKAYGSEASSTYEALNTGLLNGVLTTDQYNAQTTELLSGISTLGADATMVLSKMFANVGIPEETVEGIDSLDARVALLKAAMAGVTGLEDTAKELKAANGDAKKEQIILTKLEKKRADAVLYTSQTQERLNEVQKETDNKAQATALEEYLEKAREEAALKIELEAQGYSAADAQLILSNEMLRGAYATAVANGTLDEYNKNLAEFKKIEGSRSGGGAAQKSPFQETIDKLKEQKTEISNTINAYSKLRKAGFGVSEASDLAADSMTAAALASQKVGSKGYDDLLKKIKEVKKAQDELADVDPQLGTDRYNEAFGKLTSYFDSQEALLDASNEAATKTNRALIETLEDQIEGYNRQIGAFERDLDKIAEKEDAINKSYDKKTKALETVKKLNQDIINQQKSQLSIANALSQGDVSAAASAIQDARAQNAAAQGDTQAAALEAGRQAQLGAVAENGLTRAQIEEKIKGLKKNISDIEIGSLRTAQDAVKAADAATASAKLLLDYKGKTRKEWEDEALAVEAAKDKALVYEQGVHKALKTAENLVKQWGSLNTTITTNHVINTIRNDSGSPSGTKTDPKPTANATSSAAALAKLTSGQKLTNPERALLGMAPVAPKNSLPAQFIAKGGMVKPAYFNAGGFARGTDTVPAMLTPGEFVINKTATEKHGPLINSINNGSMSELLGSLQPPVYNPPQRSYPEGPSGISYSTSKNAESPSSVDNSVYNYNLSVNVEGSNLSANDVANQVMNKIKQVDAQRMRNQVIR